MFAATAATGASTVGLLNRSGLSRLLSVTCLVFDVEHSTSEIEQFSNEIASQPAARTRQEVSEWLTTVGLSAVWLPFEKARLSERWSDGQSFIALAHSRESGGARSIEFVLLTGTSGEGLVEVVTGDVVTGRGEANLDESVAGYVYPQVCLVSEMPLREVSSVSLGWVVLIGFLVAIAVLRYRSSSRLLLPAMLLLTASTATKVHGEGGDLLFEPAVVSFGTHEVNPNKSLSTKVTVINQSDRKIEVDALRVSCGCLDANPDFSELAPGEAGIIDVELKRLDDFVGDKAIDLVYEKEGLKRLHKLSVRWTLVHPVQIEVLSENVDRRVAQSGRNVIDFGRLRSDEVKSCRLRVSGSRDGERVEDFEIIDITSGSGFVSSELEAGEPVIEVSVRGPLSDISSRRAQMVVRTRCDRGPMPDLVVDLQRMPILKDVFAAKQHILIFHGKSFGNASNASRPVCVRVVSRSRRELQVEEVVWVKGEERDIESIESELKASAGAVSACVKIPESLEEKQWLRIRLSKPELLVFDIPITQRLFNEAK
ncbi:hypothetical protein RISK_000045 [Rhodopirellula islandica]|uniref:Transmembrane protein n=2 Tax=Rhodopirellula islandica TaxID=595434 RepID=A0A0J1BMW6_RHOIS|nr:hypothetical protein RISK_000045 [Rhodopirellula islandica]